jgi:hypothetical protein
VYLCYDVTTISRQRQQEREEAEKKLAANLLLKIPAASITTPEDLTHQLFKARGLLDPLPAPSPAESAQQPVQGAESDPVSPEGATKPSTSSAGSSATQDQQAQQGSQATRDPLEGVTVDVHPVNLDGLKEEGRRYKEGSDRLDKESSLPQSIIPQIVRNHPLACGLGGGAAVLALLVAKIKADYDKNPPVDESGEIIPFNKHLASEFISLNATKMNFWLKATALGLAGAGIYLKSTVAAAA